MSSSSTTPPGILSTTGVSSSGSVSISEVSSPARICLKCERHGLVAGSSFDLHTGYDLSKYSVQKEVEAIIEKEQPKLLVGSPPCTKFSILQNLVIAKGLTDQQRDKFEIELAQQCAT